MTRSTLAIAAFVGLILLTVASLFASSGEMGPWPVAGLAVLKGALIGWVFLELDRSRPRWLVAMALLLVGIAGGAALLISV